MPIRTFEVDQKEYPFTSHWFERDGAHMHYIDEGEGIPVVMCHGNPTWSFLYRDIIKELSGECRCIAYDLPGFGFSEHPKNYGYTPMEHADWIKALVIDHLGLEEFIVVCQDWGGPTSLHVATTHPDKVLGLVISSTWAWPAIGPMVIWAKVMGSRFGRWLSEKYNIFPAKIVPSALPAGKQKDQKILDAYLGPFPTRETRRGPAEFPGQIINATPWLAELEQRLSTLKDKPVEFIFGLADPLLNTKKIKARWLTHFPNAKAHEIPDVGHFAQEDCPERFVQSVRDILAQVNPGR